MPNHIEQFPTDTTKRVRKYKQKRYQAPDENHLGMNYCGQKKRVNYYLSEDAKLQLAVVQKHCAEYGTGKNPYQYDMVHIALSIFSIGLFWNRVEKKHLTIGLDAHKTRCVNGDLDDLSENIKNIVNDQLELTQNLSLSDLVSIALNGICNDIIPFIKESREAITIARFDETQPYVLILPTIYGGSKKPKLVLDANGGILQIVLNPLWRNVLKGD